MWRFLVCLPSGFGRVASFDYPEGLPPDDEGRYEEQGMTGTLGVHPVGGERAGHCSEEAERNRPSHGSPINPAGPPVVVGSDGSRRDYHRQGCRYRQERWDSQEHGDGRRDDAPASDPE